MLHSVRSLRINIALHVAVIPGVRENNTTNGSFFVGYFRFDPTPGTSVPGNDNLSLYIYALTFQDFIIGRNTIIDIDQLGRHITIGRIGVIPGKAILHDGRGGIFFQNRLLKLSCESGR